MSDNQFRRSPREPADPSGPDRGSPSPARPGGASAWPDRRPRDCEPPPGAGVPRPGYNTYRGRDDPFARGQEAALPYGLGSQPGPPGRGYPPHPVEGVSRLLTQMFLVWRDMLGPLVPQGSRGEPAQYDAPREAEYGAPREAQYGSLREKSCVTFDITTSKRVEVTLSLDLEEDLAALDVLDLVAVVDPAERGAPRKNPRSPPIQDVRIERTDDGAVVVRLTVPAEQPAGTYLGMIVDAARVEPRGDVRVRVKS